MSKRTLYSIALLVLIAVPTFSQKKVVTKIAKTVTSQTSAPHVTFLASDEMRGRGTGSPEVAIAANYIAAQFSMAGLKPGVGGNSFFQEVGLQQTAPPKALTVTLGNATFKWKEDLVMIKGSTMDFEGDVVYVGFATAEELNNIEVEGKIVICTAGNPATTSASQALLKDSPSKYKLVSEKGGIALIELVAFSGSPWPVVASYLSGPQTILADINAVMPMPHIWLRKSENEEITKLIQNKTGRGALKLETTPAKSVAGKNVIGIVEGTDEKLKNEFVVLSAHYDHIGTNKNKTQDSIFNGARDNAIGTAAILEAARYLGVNPTKRSVLFIAYCAEEKGMLGSRWYAAYPTVDLKQTVFDLNCDGAGYNDKTRITLVDLNRTSADQLLQKACESVGLTLNGDPAPEQNLYDRSDNVSFAAKGVPSVNISPGVKSFDQELLKYYHQPADEASTLDFDYLAKFFRAYAYAAYLIGNAPERPVWKTGDKYEAAGKALYEN